MVLAGCSATELPPANASAREVLDAYLVALRAGDCTAAHALSTEKMLNRNGDLCGRVEISKTRVEGNPVELDAGSLTYETTLTVTDADESMHDGENTWFYSLKREDDGAWRVAGGGTGP
jgi:hypothetical protein